MILFKQIIVFFKLLIKEAIYPVHKEYVTLARLLLLYHYTRSIKTSLKFVYTLRHSWMRDDAYAPPFVSIVSLCVYNVISIWSDPRANDVYLPLVCFRHETIKLPLFHQNDP